MAGAQPLTEANRAIYRGYPVPVHTLRVKRIMAMLAALPPGRLLDLGCAQGELGLMALRSGWMVCGLDIDRSNATTARERGLQTALATLAAAFPFAPGAFDCILAAEVLEHLLDTQLLLSECLRLLRPGGSLILSTPNLASLTNRLRLLFGMYPNWMDFKLGWGAGHVRYYTLPVLRQQLHELGFQIAWEVGTAIEVPLVSRIGGTVFRSLMSFLALRIPSLASGLVILAVKPECENQLEIPQSLAVGGD